MQYKRLLYQGMASLLVVTAMPVSSYAKPADNNVAPSAIYGARINMSIDQKSIKYAPQYFDPNKIYAAHSTSLVDIPGLTTAQMDVARKIISGLQDLELSDAMLAGILGNIMQECSFNTTATTGKYYGIVQWGDGRRKTLESMSDYETAETQTEFLKAELLGTSPATGNYGKDVDRYLNNYDNSDMKTVEDVEMACEAFCVVVEGCINGNDLAKNGKKYQHLNKRKEYAKKFMQYLKNGGATSDSVQQFLSIAKSKLGCPYVWGAKGPDKFDCSGFVYWCLNQAGISVPYRTTAEWKKTQPFPQVSFDELRPGDIILEPGHIGIVAENGMVIDASSSNKKVVHRQLGSWWKNNFVNGFRVFDN